MKRTGWISGLLAALVLAAPLTAGARDDDRRDDRGERWGQRVDAQHVRHGHFRDHRDDRYRRGRGFRSDWHGGWWRYPQPHGWRPGWPYRWDSRRHGRWAHGPLADWRRRDNGSFITGALIGSTLTHSALHERGDHRYCDHDRGRYDGGTRCYRVQLLPGGMERRVPLPNTACF
jgi:hypothetical protein